TLFAAGRDEELNQKTINKRMIIMLQAMRRAGAQIQLHKAGSTAAASTIMSFQGRQSATGGGASHTIKLRKCA
ncbi:MAG: hypothetical protein WAM85_18475, partial [Terracidiphilus sp.]